MKVEMIKFVSKSLRPPIRVSLGKGFHEDHKAQNKGSTRPIRLRKRVLRSP